MNPSIFKPKQLVENSVEKARCTGAAASLLTPAKNAAVVEMQTIIILFTGTYEQRPVPFGLNWSSPFRGLKASQTVRVLHKD
jgi:hypothetical protein